MAAAQSQKRFENVKEWRSGLEQHSVIMTERALASILLDWHFRQAQKNHFLV